MAKTLRWHPMILRKAVRETGVLVVYGSGFGTAPADGYLRIVFLAHPNELREVYKLMADYTAAFLSKS